MMKHRNLKMSRSNRQERYSQKPTRKGPNNITTRMTTTVTGTTQKTSSNDDGKRLAANMKERVRVQRMNKAFVELKKVLPKMTSATKLDLLLSAKNYIQFLTEVLQESFGKDIKSILNGHKVRKVCGLRTNQMMPLENPETILKFPVQSPKSAIPFQEENWTSPNLINQGNNTGDLGLFLTPMTSSKLQIHNPATTMEHSPMQAHQPLLTQVSPSETIFTYSVQSPKSHIPFQKENVMNQVNVADNFGQFLSPVLTQLQNYEQVTVNSDAPIQACQPLSTQVSPDLWSPISMPNHRVTKTENTQMRYNNSFSPSPSIQAPSPASATQENPADRQSLKLINDIQAVQPTLSEELDQFCCEIFDVLPTNPKKLRRHPNLPEF